MTVAAKKLAEQVLALPESDREKLLRLLRDSLPHEDETLSQQEWDEEPGVPLDEVLAELQKPVRKF
jgi:hypothetical protein